MLDDKHVKNLRESGAVFGWIYPMIEDEKGEVRVGRHRKAAGCDKTEKVDFGALAKEKGIPVDEYMIYYEMTSNFQRQPGEEEMRSQVNMLAEKLLKRGIPRGQIAREIRRYIPIPLRTLHKWLGSQFKLETRPKKDSTRAISKEESTVAEEKTSCPYCGSKISKAKDMSTHNKWLRNDRVLEERIDEYRKLMAAEKQPAKAGELETYFTSTASKEGEEDGNS